MYLRLRNSFTASSTPLASVNNNTANSSPVREFTLRSIDFTPPPRRIEIFLWGAGGAGGTVGGWSFGSFGAAGDAAYGYLDDTTTSTILSWVVMVGGAGIVNSFGSNPVGGGSTASNNNGDNRYSGGGGGLSGIFNGSYAQGNSILIAGGGGGGGSSRAGTGNSGGAGGGTVGENGFSPYDGKTSYAGRAGTQSQAGDFSSTDFNTGGGGQGALQGGVTRAQSYGGGGGGGYWGGSGGGYSESNTMAGGGGGSGFLSPTLLTGGELYTGSGTNPGNAGSSLRGSFGAAGGYQGNGTQGLAVIRYPGQQQYGSGGTVIFDGTYTIHTFSTTGLSSFSYTR